MSQTAGPAFDTLPSPPLRYVLTEPGRAIGERWAHPFATKLLRTAPRGDGHSVITLPGFMGGDGSMRLTRKYLRSKGYRPYPWLLGRNEGPQSSGEEGRDLDARVSQIYEWSGEKVSLVGWSLGGVMARNAARRQPEKIRQVITLGSPFEANPGASSIERLFKLVSGRDPQAEEFAYIYDYNRPQPPESVPTTSIFTKTDGIVHWRSTIERPSDHTDNIEVYASHIGLGFNAAVHYLLAERLAQPDGEWAPFDRKASLMRRVLFPSSGHVYGYERYRVA